MSDTSWLLETKAISEWEAANRPYFDYLHNHAKGLQPYSGYTPLEAVDQIAAAACVELSDLFADLEELVGDLAGHRLTVVNHNHTLYVVVRRA